MPKWMLRTPNGKLAIFSTIVDGFTVYDIDEDEAAAVADRHLRDASSARTLAGALLDRPLLGGKHQDEESDGLRRWRESIRIMALNCTRDQVRANLAEIGFSDYDFESVVHVWPREEDDGSDTASKATS